MPDLTRKFERKGVGHPSPEEASKLYMQAVAAWLDEFHLKITENHYLRLNAPRVNLQGKKLRYERTADLILHGTVAGTFHDKTVGRKVVRFAIEWDKGA